jgi:hypothetical protein
MELLTGAYEELSMFYLLCIDKSGFGHFRLPKMR